MKTPKPLHIFKPGTWITTAGEEISFSQADLDATAAAYDPTRHKAPIVVGHPKSDDPAQGWAKSLLSNERGLYAEPMKVAPAFAEEVNAGRFGTISAKFYRPEDLNNPKPGIWYLRHIGFLGAQPPAVKGLDEPSFAEDSTEDDGCVCFQEGVAFGGWGLDTSASLFRRLRDWLIGQHGQETADQVVPDWQIESIREAAQQERNDERVEGSSAFSESHPQPNDEEHTVTPEEKAQLEAENTRLKQQLAVAEADKRNAAATKRHGEHAAFAEGLVGEGRLAPKAKAAVVALLDAVDGEAPVEFGEGDSKQPLADAFKSFLGELPKVVEFGEHATKDRSTTGASGASAEFAEKSTDPDRLALHQRAVALAAEKGIPYEQAVRSLV
ncbi:peptidase [Jeongeupia wiesaeckerbachi]|uniref:peptidase n=1 Tax=Jeongeupia wiesaeckerbachi TaxID=3051218 RepID=UPI003D802A63